MVLRPSRWERHDRDLSLVLCCHLLSEVWFSLPICRSIILIKIQKSTELSHSVYEETDKTLSSSLLSLSSLLHLSIRILHDYSKTWGSGRNRETVRVDVIGLIHASRGRRGVKRSDWRSLDWRGRSLKQSPMWPWGHALNSNDVIVLRGVLLGNQLENISTPLMKHTQT